MLNLPGVIYINWSRWQLSWFRHRASQSAGSMVSSSDWKWTPTPGRSCRDGHTNWPVTMMKGDGMKSFWLSTGTCSKLLGFTGEFVPHALGAHSQGWSQKSAEAAVLGSSRIKAGRPSSSCSSSSTKARAFVEHGWTAKVIELTQDFTCPRSSKMPLLLSMKSPAEGVWRIYCPAVQPSEAAADSRK